MKKLFLIIGTFIIFCLFNIGQAQSKLLKNANDLQIYMRRNFSYKKDTVVKNYFEYFQIPSVLEFSRAGDCDDFALYSYYYLDQMNYDAKMFFVYSVSYNGKSYGHAITVFLDDDNTYSIFSNAFIIKTDKTNALEAIKDVNETWVEIYIWRPTKFGLVTKEEVNKDMYFIEKRK